VIDGMLSLAIQSTNRFNDVTDIRN